ncbi:hypothetical protein E2986_03228 [Frieseomelitta varia]|uniref:Transgelin n=1 Tax=Frieseomelitta varia TaxID=561572 RepID=A0A833RXW5_9HYME|nr:hypothetical protein E2986_03228 [Frieseomelitta varia]
MFLGVSYEDALRDGVLLCKLMNKLQPGLITKINTSGGDYKMMDNLNQYVSYKNILISHERISVLNNAIIMYHYFRFQKACVKYGVPDVDLFQAVDLIERKNIAQVTNTIFAIGRTVIILKHIFYYCQMCTIAEKNNNNNINLQTYRHPEWRGPWLGPKPSEENKRNFTEEQLRAGEGYIGLQAGTNKGATQAGQNFGATRKILLGK